jgi:hypothetical protein
MEACLERLQPRLRNQFPRALCRDFLSCSFPSASCSRSRGPQAPLPAIWISSTTSSTDRLAHSSEKIHTRPILVIVVVLRLIRDDGLEDTAAKYAHDLRRVLAGEVHFPQDIFVKCGVFNLPGCQSDPDLAPVVAATLQFHPAVRDLQRVEIGAVANQGAVTAVTFGTSHPRQLHVPVLERAHAGIAI